MIDNLGSVIAAALLIGSKSRHKFSRLLSDDKSYGKCALTLCYGEHTLSALDNWIEIR